ncbi:hypothetical protein LCGC14_2426600 [marine sediment metagenome]|uniref:HNH nuclease domain-containing protein n=1 Tax=marine sediment metagenome TaxID=412755 RepID=A0A0F9BN85_9ZZZZ
MTIQPKIKPCIVTNCNKLRKTADIYCSMHRARLVRTRRLDKKQPYERLSERIFINLDNGCWKYIGFINKDGYGRFRVNGKKTLAHRFMYLIVFGAIPNELLVCHKCDNPKCVNPNHLFLGTDKDNVRDSINKKRWRHTVVYYERI